MQSRSFHEDEDEGEQDDDDDDDDDDGGGHSLQNLAVGELVAFDGVTAKLPRARGQVQRAPDRDVVIAVKAAVVARLVASVLGRLVALAVSLYGVE